MDLIYRAYLRFLLAIQGISILFLERSWDFIMVSNPFIDPKIAKGMSAGSTSTDPSNLHEIGPHMTVTPLLY